MQGRIFFESDEEKAVTVIGDFFIVQVEDIDQADIDFFTRRCDVLHHEGEHVTSARPFSGKTDFLVWRCRMTSPISRSFTP